MHIHGTFNHMHFNFHLDGAMHIQHHGDKNMAATVQQIMDVMSAVKVSMGNIAMDIQSLKDQVAAGGVVTQFDLDNMLAKAEDVAMQADSLDMSTP